MKNDKIDNSPTSPIDENDFDKDLKYKINPDKLGKHLDDLLLLEDWLPFEIIRYLPLEIAFKSTHGEKVENKQL